MRIRAEEEHDVAAIYHVNASAFETSAEAELVDTLRREATPLISLVAEESGTIIGHILFSPVTLSTDPVLKMMGLGPMAVVPTHQRQGIGSELVRAGLEWCKETGYRVVVVLGHPDYYPRFGLRRAAEFGLRCEFEAPDEAFMALECEQGVLDQKSGVVKYHAAFSA